MFYYNMTNYWKVVNYVIRRSDILLLIMDARFLELTRHPEIEMKIKGKPLLYVLNKCDLVPKKDLFEAKRKLPNSVFISARDHLGTQILRQKIKDIAKGKKVTVGVLGYPNTGKSSVINALKGRKSAGTSPHAGYTKGKQLVKISPTIFLLDTPGVLPYKERDEEKLALIGAKDYRKVKDPDLLALILIKEKRELVCNHYQVSIDGTEEDILDAIAIKYKKIKKGGLPDLLATGCMILKDWQEGRLCFINKLV